MSATRACAIAAAVLLAAGCGSSSSSTKTAPTTTGAPAATTGSMSGSGAEMSTAAPVPSDLHCAGAIVWVNLSSRAFHRSDDPFYGRTKNGEYLCEAAAEAKGYHLAGSPHHRTSSPAAPVPSST